MSMRKIMLICGLISLFVNQAHAQLADSTKQNKNVLKINLLSLPFNNLHVQYERQIGEKMSVALGFRYMPEGNIPLKSTVLDLIDDPDATKHLTNLKTGNFAVTPEVRFYLGKAALKGFYIAPFARYSRYTASLPFDFTVEDDMGGEYNEVIPLEGKLTTITGGLLLGSQFRLGKMVTLDWWILGPQYGSSKGNVAGRKNLSPEEQQELRDQLNDITDLPLVKVTTKVDGNGADVDIKGPWAGVRAGLALGIRF